MIYEKQLDHSNFYIIISIYMNFNYNKVFFINHLTKIKILYTELIIIPINFRYYTYLVYKC